MARPCPCIAVTISVYAASASSGTDAAAVYGLPCCEWRSMPAMLLLALQFSLFVARISLFHTASASCLSRLPLHRFPLCRERLLCLGAHRGPFKAFAASRARRLGFFAGLLVSVALSPKNESFSHSLVTNRRISSSDAPRRRRCGRRHTFRSRRAPPARPRIDRRDMTMSSKSLIAALRS